MGYILDRARTVATIAALIVSGVLGAALSGVSDAGAAETWAVRSGRVHVAFNVGLLHDLGLDLEVTGAEATRLGAVRLEEPYWTLAILPGSDLTFTTERSIVSPRGGTAGAIRLAGVLVVREQATGKQTRFDALEIAHLAVEGPAPTGARGTDPLLLRSATSRLAFCELRNAMFDFRGRPSLEVHYLNARITESWARAIGRPDLAGWVVGIAEVRAETERLSATGPEEPAPPPVFTGGTVDVSLGGLADIQEVAHVGTFPGGRTATAMATTSCNVGAVDVPWLAPMLEDHPVIHMALYRVLDDRFEQLGVSWMKHGFYALSLSDCTPCQHPSEGDFLGVGCSDTYDAYNNSDREFLGPRSEVNAYTGTWECTGSHFAEGQPDCEWRHNAAHGPLDHRLDANDADLANPGATYWYEACYVVAGDQDLGNNWGHRRCTMVWTGGVWSFSTPANDNPLVEGPALSGWDAAATHVNVAPGDGQVLLSGTATPRGDGTYHYEYALMNLNSDRQIRSFSVPVRGVANISSLGFHDSDADATNDWQVTADSRTITWQTDTYAQNPNANALVFGYLYNFRFDADAPPAALGVTLGLFKPGAGPRAVFTTTSAPANVVAGVGDATPAAGMIDVRPNPFSHSATISYRATAGPTDLGIYDASGRLVRSLVGRDGDGGVRSVVWNGDVDGGGRARSGVYYARLRSGAVTAVRPLVLAD